MNDLERRVWWLLRAYPQAWQDERGEDLVATVLALSRPGQRWPSVRVVMGVVHPGGGVPETTAMDAFVIAFKTGFCRPANDEPASLSCTVTRTVPDAAAVF